MRKKNNILFIIICILFTARISAQDVDVKAGFSLDSIIIGQQIELFINAQSPKNVKIIPALLEDTVIENIEILHIFDIEKTYDSINNKNIFTERYIVTSFDTGYYYIPKIKLNKIIENDTLDIFTNELELFVKPYVLIDTIPVDTIYAGRNGFIIYGKNGFQDEINQAIPDSVKKQLSTDSLQIVRDGIAQQYFQMFSSHVMNNTGLTDRAEILTIVESNAQSLFIINRDGIKEKHIVAGSVDSVFVEEFQSVNTGTPLFTLYQIKDIDESLFITPFNFTELWYYFVQFIKKYWWLIIIIFAIAVAVLYYIFYYSKGEKPVFLRIKPQEPAHIIALRKLEQIRNEKIWKSGQYKEYHVQITAVVREYIENRFGIDAPEMTSSETLQSLTDKLEPHNFEKLKQILLLADTVKFAKAVPMQNENDLSLKNAFEFVENTKEIEEDADKIKQVEAEIEIKNEETAETDNEENNKNKDLKDE